MNQPTLAPGHVVYSYVVSGDCFFQLNGKRVQAEELFVEADPHNDVFAAQIITSCNQIITYQSRDYDSWHPVARRLFRLHTASRRHLGN